MAAAVGIVSGSVQTRLAWRGWDDVMDVALALLAAITAAGGRDGHGKRGISCCFVAGSATLQGRPFMAGARRLDHLGLRHRLTTARR